LTTDTIYSRAMLPCPDIMEETYLLASLDLYFL